MNSRSKWVTFAAATLWGVALVLWPAPTDLRMIPEEGKHATSSGEGLYKPDLTQANFGLLGVRFFESTSGEKSWNMRSEFAELHRQKEDYAFMKVVTADFFANQSRNVIRATSDYGRSHFKRRLVELEGNVVVKSQLGYRFMMNRLDYDSAKQKFHTLDPVQMLGPNVDKPDMFLTGTGLDADLNTDKFVIRKFTRARRRLHNDEWIKIQASQGQFEPESNKALFVDRVKAVTPQLSIESDRLEMDVQDPENEVLRASGHVVLHHKDRRGTAHRADVELGNDKVVLEGNAMIRGKDNEMTGRKIVLYTDDDRVEVEQAKGSMQQ